MTKIRLCLSGANGRMCEALARSLRCDKRFEVAFGVDRADAGHYAFPVYTSFDDAPPCDVVVDFSSPTLTALALKYASRNRIPIVVATTGQTDDNVRLIHQTSKTIPVFFDSNTSIGNCLLLKLASLAASFLDESFDVEIVETHHRIKVDAPSGTALQLARAIQFAKAKSGKEYTICKGHESKREAMQIGVHSLRGGTVVGKHEVFFLGDDERITISHEVENKSVFVHGALKAAEFLMCKQNGLFGMHDLVNSQTN